MRKFSKKDILADSTRDEKWQAQKDTEDMLSHPEGYLAYSYGQDVTSSSDSDRGSQVITKYDPEYSFLVKLVKLLTKEGVPPQEIKSIADAYPFVTVDDVGDLTAKLWTLATTKYNIPRDFLINSLPKNSSLKTAAGEFTGAEFSTDDYGVNPSMDIGPFSSPQDSGATDQKSPWPNSDWLPADDQNLDEEPSSDIASRLKRPFSKKANPDSRYWIAPDGTEYNAGTNHGAWVKVNKDLLAKQYGIKNPNLTYAENEMYKNGWIRVSNEPAGSGFQIQVQDINGIPIFLDNFISQHFTTGDRIQIGDQSGHYVEISDPFPTLQKAVRKNLRRALLKQADLSGQIVNQVLNSIHANGGATFNLSQGNMVGTNNYAVSIYPERSEILPAGTDFDTLEQFMLKNEDLLNNAENSIGAWVNGGKLYLDVVATVPDEAQAIELGKQHNQIAIWDLKNGTEIQTGGTGEVQKKAEEQILPQDQQDQIAATTSPIYNTALNNYAQAVKRGHEKDRALEYAIQSVSNMEKIDPKKLVELINNYL